MAEDGDSEPPPLLDPENPLGPPGINYQTASQSGTYRLSELMFGSLLATYALGFIGGVTARIEHVSPPPVEGLIRFLYHELGGSIADGTLLLPTLRVLAGSFDYLLISLTFSCLTASLYLAYHSGMLTMPQIPLRRLRFDFAVALSQASCFGLAMLSPVLFPVCLGAAIGLALFRQAYEVTKLEEYIHYCLSREAKAHPRVLDDPSARQKKPERDAAELDQKLNRELRRSISEKLARSSEVFRRKNIAPLAVWQRSSWYAWAFVALLLVFGGSILFFPPGELWVRIVNGAVVLCASLAVVVVSGNMLKERGSPLIQETQEGSMMDELDNASKDLWAELKTLLKTSSPKPLP